MAKIFVYDPTIADKKSAVRGVGRYLQILKETFPQWNYTNQLKIVNKSLSSVFINPFFNFLQPPLTLKKIARTQIAIIHDLIPLKYPDYFPTGLKGKINIFLNKLALKNYDLIVTDSFASKRDIVSMLKISEDKVKVIYPCLPMIFTEKNQKLKIKNKNYNLELKNNSKIFPPSLLTSNFCLYVGDATWNKNLVNLARAIKMVNVTCVFVGRVFHFPQAPPLSHPWQKELKTFLEETKNDQRFIFPGFINDYQLLKFYQQAKVNILISRDEGFGFSYLEAASQGCPSVISKIDVLKEISACQGVLFADGENPNDIADKIGEIYFHRDLRDKLSSNAQQRAQFFTTNKFKSEFLQFL